MLYSLEANEDQYLEIVDGYDVERPEGVHAVDLYSQAFGALQQGLSETDADLLGVIYEELGQGSEAFGQHFTPHDVCDTMAEMIVDIDETRDQPYLIADPTSGSGRLLVHVSKHLPPEKEAIYYGQDKDPSCAKMTALNLCFFNLDGYAEYGNSLTMDQYRVWQTESSIFGGAIRELDQEEFPAISFDTVPESKPHDSDTMVNLRDWDEEFEFDESDDTGTEK